VVLRKGRQRERLVVTAVTMEPRLIARIDALAARERRSRSFMVREAVERYLQEFAERRP
jgi:metal-responsive CopG/Arc/MetJ family transcriptional regulator